MNEIINSLYSRKSVRAYEQRPIPEEYKAAIIRAAIEAPTAGGQSFYTMIDVREQEIKDRLSILCDNQPFISKAPMVIIYLADCRRWYDSYIYAGLEPRKPGLGDLSLAIADAVIAAQNTVVAAESLGIGSCYIGDVIEQEEQVRELLNLDEYVFPAAMLVYGFPVQSQKDRQKPPRFNKDYLVMQNRYRRLTKEEHVSMFEKSGRLNSGISAADYIGNYFKNKYMSGFSLEMCRSAKKYFNNFES